MHWNLTSNSQPWNTKYLTAGVTCCVWHRKAEHVSKSSTIVFQQTLNLCRLLHWKVFITSSHQLP